MSTAQRTESKAVATLAENASVGKLPAAIQQQLELRKLSNQIAGKLAEQNWGKALDLETRRAIADWGREYSVDVVTEIHVLGGNIYLNAVYYLRRLAEQIAAGVIEYAYADHVEVDDRLAQLGEEGMAESSRRLRERILHGVPDKAASAVVFRIKPRNLDREITGTKWCGNGTRKNDPVGEQFPVESSESRAARRAMRHLAGHMPAERVAQLIRVEDSAAVLSDRVETARREFKDREKQIAIVPKPLLAPANPADPYSVTSSASQPETAPVSAAEPAPVRREPTDDDPTVPDSQRSRMSADELDQLRFED